MMLEEEMEEFDGAVVVGQKPTVMVPRHISKRSLRNKVLSINFDEKNLRDYVTGFQKRKKKRRKEAQKQLHEKERKMRIEARKKRKEAKELALSNGLKNRDSNLERDGCSDYEEEDGPSTVASVSETKTYENSNTTIIVTTSELGKDKEELEPARIIPKLISSRLEKNHKLLAKRKSMKGPAKQKPQKKASKSASRRKEKNKMNKY